jgi:organic hydroperoxide reductase OsmC/OhrA
MSSYSATISWQPKAGDNFLGKRYSRVHTWKFDGGVELPASSSPHVVPVPYSDPAAIDPEEALIASICSCHMLSFLFVACKGGFAVESYDDTGVGTLEKNAEGRLAITRVQLKPHVKFAAGNVPDEATFAALHHEAHEACFIANSVKCEIVCDGVMAG